jgi:hypothetical protein
MKKPLQSTISA